MKPYPFQPPGAEWLATHSRSGLFDEQGLGKTITAILACRAVQAQRVLVICPSVVLYNWAREFVRWAPEYPLADVLAKTTHQIEHLRITDRLVVLTTHGLSMKPGIRAQLMNGQWDVVILDESHFFRSPDALRTIGFYGLQGVPGLASTVNTKRVWLLSGTPTPNNAAELWPALYGLQPKRLLHEGRVMSYETFRDRFCKTKPPFRGGDPVIVGNKPDMLPELRARLDGFYLRRLAKDHLPDLPPIRFEGVTLATGDKARVEEAEAHLPHVEIDPNDLQELEQNMEFAAWRRACGLAKVKPAAELLNMELAEPSGLGKVVVFAHHTDVVKGLVHELGPDRCVSITGATSAKDRDAAVQAFQNNPGVRAAVCNIVAGGTGATLTAASDVVFVEMDFVPGNNAQAVKRCHRIGQTQRVRARVLSLAGSIDEAVCSVLRRKTQMIREVIDV